jgi:hypothetical protein
LTVAPPTWKLRLRIDIVLGEDAVFTEEVRVGVLGESDQRAGGDAGIGAGVAIGIH